MPALLLLAPLAACGGNGGAAPDLAPVCPCSVRTDVLLGGPIRIKRHSYTVRSDRTQYEVYGGPEPQYVDTTLTTPLEVALAKRDGVSVLHIVGCRGGELVWVTFGDLDDDGVVDDRIGEYPLPPALMLSTLTWDRIRGVILAYAPRRRSILRFTDADADFVPDGYGVLAAHSESTPILPAIEEICFAPGGTVLCLAPGRVGSMDTVTAITDADHDGTAEAVVSLPYVEFRQPRPQFVLPPRAGDTALEIFGIPGTTIEVWRTEAEGRKVGDDPPGDRLGSTTLGPATARGRVLLDAPLVAGDTVTLFDARPDTLSGPATRVAASYPIATSVTPRSIDRKVSSTLTVTGNHFGADTSVTLLLEGPRLSLDLSPTVQSDTRLTVTVPALGTEWVGAARVRAHNAHSPHHEIGQPIIVHR